MGSHQYQPGIYTMMGSKFMILVPRLIYLIGYRDMNKPTQIGESFVTHKDNKDLAAFSSSICHTGSYVLAENISSCDIGPKSPFPTSTLSHEVARSAEADSFTAQYRYFPFKANDSSSWLYNKQLYTSQLVGPSLSHDTSLSPKFPLPISTVSDGSKSRELGSPRQRSNPHQPTSQSISYQEHRGQELPRRRSRYNLREPDRTASPVFIPPNANPAHPLEHQKESPPEGEATSLSTIRNTLQNPSIYSTRYQEQQDHDSQYSTSNPRAVEQFRTHRATTSQPASITSAETPISTSSRISERSGISTSSRSQHKSTAGVKRNKPSGGKKKRTSANTPRIFYYTFCCDKFKSKYDQIRHKKSLHLNLETQVCAPFRGYVILLSTSRVHCTYYNQLDPLSNHLE